MAHEVTGSQFDRLSTNLKEGGQMSTSFRFRPSDGPVLARTIHEPTSFDVHES